MTFRRDLETWTADQVALRGLSGLSSDIRRLLRGADVGGLSPVDSSGLPSEILEAFPPSRDVPTEPPPESSTWICWPSADNAPYGWGDPYGPNPPLGTIQPSFSDTAHIAREIDASGGVTHGVNKIAAPRDWRHDSTPLVVSWDSGAIYAGGETIVYATGILAACVRWQGGTPYLLWLRENPDAVYAQQCEIDDDAVTGVIGDITTMTIAGGMIDVWWCEFSQDGSSAVINLGSDVTINKSYTIDLPWPFAGQSVSPDFAAEAKDPITNWADYDDYNGTQEFLIKSQFIGNTVTNVWLESKIAYLTLTTATRDPPITTCENEILGTCFWDLCGNSVYTWNDTYPSQAVHSERVYNIDMRVLVEETEIYSGSMQDTLIEGWQWVVNAASDNPGDYPGFPASTTGPFPGWCPYPPRVEIANSSIIYSKCAPRQTIDAQTGTVVLIDFGKGTTFNLDKEYWLRIEAHRGQDVSQSDEIEGNFGYLRWPLYTQGVTENTLIARLSETAITFCPADAGNIPSYGSTLGLSSLILSGSVVVACAWGTDIDNDIDYYVDWMEGDDIDDKLSISGEENQRIIIRSENRYFGLLKQT